MTSRRGPCEYEIALRARNRMLREQAKIEREVRMNQQTLRQLAQTHGPQLIKALAAILEGGLKRPPDPPDPPSSS